MANTQNIKVKYKLTDTGKTYTKTFSGLDPNTFADTDEGKEFLNKYGGIVAGAPVGGELQQVKPFEAD